MKRSSEAHIRKRKVLNFCGAYNNTELLTDNQTGGCVRINNKKFEKIGSNK